MEYFTHLPQYQVMVCNECCYAVLPSQIDSHLSSPKHRVPASHRRKIQNEIQAWPQLFQTEADLMQLRVPTNIPPHVTQLEVHADGRKCNECNYIVRTDKRMQSHCRTQHGWINNWKKGPKAADRRRSGLSVNRPWTVDVYCQRFFTHGRRQEYFEVQAPRTANGAPSETAEDTLPLWEQGRIRLRQKWSAVQEKAGRMIEEGQGDEVNPWLERAGWQSYLIGLDRTQLVQCVSRPDEEEEPVNAAIWQIMDELIQYCQHSVIHRVGVFVRLEAIRTEKHQTRYHPLQPYMDAEGIAKYSRPWKQVLMFIARTQEAHDWESPPYQLNASQSQAWEILLREVQAVAERQDENDRNDNDENDRNDDNRNNNDGNKNDRDENNTTPVMTNAHRACLKFCYELLQQRITQKEYDSALVCALAVLGVKSEGWMGPDQYPPMLSAMIKISRFMVVQQALEYEQDEEDDDNRGRQPFVGCLNWVKKMMDEFMVRGSHSPMQWMLDLRTYGMKIHYNTTADGHIDWQGDLVLYKKIQFTMPQFRGMIHGLVAEARRILQEDLMFTREDEMPIIPWSKLRDDPVNKQPGWNFTRDERNRFPVEGEWWLYDRIGRDQKLQRRFTRSGPSFAWDKGEVETYMAQVARFRENLLVLMHISGGQPARGPEILSVRHSNTVKGEHRNIFIEDQLVVFVIRYHKGYSISGDVKIIHRYLPRAVGALWVWYIWLVLPLQQKLEVDIWEKEVISSHMWPADPDGRKWTSERMRKVMRRESVAGMGVELGIQSYRELAIAISRKHLRPRMAFRPDEDDEDGDRDEDIEAVTASEQTAHTLHVEGMIYARGIMERDGEVASKRQRFRESSVSWHQFLGFPVGAPDTVVAGQKRKRAPFEEEYEEARIERGRRLRAANIHEVLKQMMGKQAEFRGVQEAAMRAIMAGESPVVVVMGTGGGKSLLFMLPALCSGGGVSVVVVPLIALRQDMKKRCQQMGIACREWNSRQPGDAAQVVLVTPKSAVSKGFRTFLNRMRTTQQLDRIVIDECHVVLNEQMNFRKQMQQQGELCGVGVQMVCLTATLPPSKEAELWRRMDFDAEEVRLFRAVTRRRNVRYAVKKVNGGDEAAKQRQVVALVQQKMRKYAEGKTVVYCSSVGKVQALAEALSCDGYYHAAAKKEEKLGAFMAGQQKVMVATSALGMGIDIPDIRVIWHVDPPRTLLDYAQESGRAGRDGLKSEAIIIQGWSRGDYGEKKEEVELVHRLIGSSSRRECRRAVLGEYLDGGEGQECREGEKRCDVCDGGADEAEEEEKEEEEEEEEEEEVEEEEEEGEEEEEVKGLEGSEEEGELEEERGLDEALMLAEVEQERRAIGIQQQRQEAMGRRGAERMQREGLELEELEQQLRRARGKCPNCVALGITPDNHSLFWCREGSSQEYRRDYAELKESIRRGRTMEAYSGCMECFLPQVWCNRWEQSDRHPGMYRQKAGETCVFADVVLSGITVALGRDEVMEGMRRRMAAAGFDITVEAEALQYLGRRRPWAGLETSELLREFYLTQRAQQE